MLILGVQFWSLLSWQDSFRLGLIRHVKGANRGPDVNMLGGMYCLHKSSSKFGMSHIKVVLKFVNACCVYPDILKTGDDRNSFIYLVPI
jgi:hypothetical protein